MKRIITAEEFNEMPEDELREHYFEDDRQPGTYVFGFRETDEAGNETVYRAEDVSGLKSAAHKERETAREARRKLSQMMESGDPELADRVSRLEADNAALRDNWAKERAAVQINNSITKFRGVAAVLAPAIRELTKTDPDTGEVYPVDDQGDPVTDPDTGEKMSLDQFVQVMREDPAYASAFIGSGSSGGGTPPGAGGGSHKGGIPAGTRRSNMKPADKVAFIREYGHDQFMRLPA